MKERITHLTPTTYKIMPWKNGAGSTTELLIAPPGATVQAGFDWRISLAQVPLSGPFSLFPEYQRTIVLLDGDPMDLLHQGQGNHHLEAFQPYDFHGSWQTEGILSGRPVQDFNVMVRDSWGRAQVHVQDGSESSVFPVPKADLTFIYICRGTATVTVQNRKHELGMEESLLIEDGSDIKVCNGSTSSVALVVSIARKSPSTKMHP